MIATRSRPDLGRPLPAALAGKAPSAARPTAPLRASRRVIDVSDTSEDRGSRDGCGAQKDGLFASLGALTNRASSMRVCPASAPSGCNAVAAPPPPPPLPNGSPATRDARLAATLAGGRKRRTVGFGRAAVVHVRLTDAGGRAIAGAALQVFTREQRAGSEWRVAPAITTDAGGSARLRLAPGPSRAIRIEYRALVGDAQPAAAARARLAVRAGYGCGSGRGRCQPATDVAAQDVVAQLAAELHAADASPPESDAPRRRPTPRPGVTARRPPRRSSPRATGRAHGLGHDRGLRHRVADDTDTSDTGCSERHFSLLRWSRRPARPRSRR